MLSKLQNLPDSSKKKIAFTLSALMTVGVFVFWVFDFSSRFGGMIVQTKAVTASVYGSFEEKFQTMYNELQTSFPVNESRNASSTKDERSTSTREVQGTTTENLLKTNNQEAQ